MSAVDNTYNNQGIAKTSAHDHSLNGVDGKNHAAEAQFENAQLGRFVTPGGNPIDNR